MKSNDDVVRVRPTPRPVRRAYEQVADQMRNWILSGALGVGDRLPNEAELAAQFGTSRSTVREALRLLSSESLIVTRPGARGGSSVVRPDPRKITDFLQGTLSLLVGTSELGIGELLAAREMLEIPATALAAEHRHEEHLARLRALLPAQPREIDPDDLFEIDRAFHGTLLQASGNRLLPLVATPVFDVIARRFQRRRAPAKFWELVVDQHRGIVDAVSASDPEAAAEAMARHIKDLGREYRFMDALTDQS